MTDTPRDTRIEPAMTAEEWQEAFDNEWFPMPMNVDEEYDLTEKPHASAALCLYGQKFGFTREDVRELRKVADLYENAKIETQDGIDTISIVLQPRIAALRSLADRIAALLPPEPYVTPEQEANIEAYLREKYKDAAPDA